MLKINEAMKIILASNSRDVVMESLDVSSPLISSWLSSNEDRIVRFDFAVSIYTHFNIVVYPYDESALKDSTYIYDEDNNSL